MGIGGMLASRLADRIGRVRAVWWSALTFSVFTSVIALCHTYGQIAIMRLMPGFGLGALYSIGTPLAARFTGRLAHPAFGLAGELPRGNLPPDRKRSTAIASSTTGKATSKM
jgi:MFS family permease